MRRSSRGPFRADYYKRSRTHAGLSKSTSRHFLPDDPVLLGKVRRFLASCDCATAETLRKHEGVPQAQSAAFTALLDHLIECGEIAFDGGKYYKIETYYEGFLTGNKNGYAFFTPEKKITLLRGETEKEEIVSSTEDFFIPAKKTNGAMHKDRVSVRIEKSRKDGEKTAGEVVKILERGVTTLVGAFYKDGRRGGRLLPDDDKYFAEIFIPPEKCKEIKSGVKAVAKILSYRYGVYPEGEIIEVLGDDDDFFAEELSILRGYSLREEFPEEAEEEAQKVAAEEIAIEKTFSKNTCENVLRTAGELPFLRRDLREKFFVTIDGADTRDIDDGIGAEKRGENYLLSVHIADVSHYVSTVGEIEKEAAKRGTSVYFPDRVLPMLPRALSNGCCSLNENQERYALTCQAEIDGKSGKTVRYEFFPSIVKSTYRITYDEADAIFAGDETAAAKFPLFSENAEIFRSLTNLLTTMRKARGKVDLSLKERKIVYDENTEKIEIPDVCPSFSRGLIEQFMVTANEAAATFLSENHAPCLYRVHESPVKEKSAALRKFAKLLGFAPQWNDEKVSPAEYAALLSKAEGNPKESVLSKVVLRSMQKARYCEDNLGHFALASDCYCHFTSPIRRYPDLFVHRAIKAVLLKSYAENGTIENGNRDTGDEIFLAEQAKKEATRRLNLLEEYANRAANTASAAEKNAEEAERAVDDLYCAVYIAEYPDEIFSGAISGVTERGFFVELKNAIEGYVPLESLKGYYTYDEETFSLHGGGRTFTLGDEVKVRLFDVNFYTRKITFSLIDE